MMEANLDVDGAYTALNFVMHILSVMGLFPAIHPWLIALIKVLHGTSPTDGLDNFVLERIAQHFDEAAQADGLKRDATFLFKMIALRNEGKVTDREVRICMEMNIVGGSDTIGISLSFILH
jgi:hypothetical protein